ncbi:hypothetical protein FDUTEX481_02808 [Tolypothrix sp. PCC 7601]|nr:hypothetical protein FDUTEX481_02808 [Tolypothrix sp. PCC 7601]
MQFTTAELRRITGSVKKFGERGKGEGGKGSGVTRLKCCNNFSCGVDILSAPDG